MSTTLNATNISGAYIYTFIWVVSLFVSRPCSFWSMSPYIHYYDVIIGTMASQITSLTIVYSTVYSDADQRKYQSSASLAFVREIHRGPVNSPHKWPVTRKMFAFDDVIMFKSYRMSLNLWKRRNWVHFRLSLFTDKHMVNRIFQRLLLISCWQQRALAVHNFVIMWVEVSMTKYS